MTDTATQERCERTDLLPSQCAHCKPNPEGEWLAAAVLSSAASHMPEPDAVAVELPSTVSTAFRAHYSTGRCTTCGEHIIRGEVIRHSGESRYAHVECP